MASPPPDVPNLSTDAATRLYPQFLSALYDSLIGPTAGTISAFRSTTEKLWPRFVSPIVNNEKPPGLNASSADWDFTRLFVRNRALFQHQGEDVLVHSVVSDTPLPFPSQQTTSSSTNNIKASSSSFSLPSLPYLPTLLLTSAYLAAHIPPRHDTLFFSKFSSSLSTRRKRAYQRKRIKALSQPSTSTSYADADNDLGDPTTPSKSGARKRKAAGTSTAGNNGASTGGTGGPPRIASFVNPRPFPLERLLAIYRAIDPHPPDSKGTGAGKPLADSIFPELATLHRLRLLVPVGSGSASAIGGGDGIEKWSLNADVGSVGTGVSAGTGAVAKGRGEWIVEMARGIGVEIEEWVMGE